MSGTRRDFVSSALGLAAAAGPGLISADVPRSYYVDPAGNDRDSGLSPTAAWASLARVNTHPFSPGDRINFLRGATFFGALSIGGERSPGDPPVVVEAYGSSPALPVFSFYKSISPSAWSRSGDDVWRAAVNDLTCISGNIHVSGAAGANIGQLCVDGDIKANKKSKISDLKKDWDFYSDGDQYLFVKSALRPSDRGKEILASPRGNILGNDSFVRYRNLNLRGAGGHGARWSGARGVDMQWCIVEQIGGSYLRRDLRYGNGAEVWVNCRDIVVSNCLFANVYDTATTMQGFPLVSPTDGWDNISLDFNTAFQCAQAIEIWATAGPPPSTAVCPPGSGFRATTSRHWKLFSIGKGPLYQARPSRAEVAPLLIYKTDCPRTDIRVSIAQMHNCGDRLLAFPEFRHAKFPGEYVIEPSRISLAPNQEIMSGMTFTAADFPGWMAAAHMARGSTIAPDNNATPRPLADIVNEWNAARRAAAGANR